MRRWELFFGIAFLMCCQGCSDLVRKVRKCCFL